ncbi:MAG: hydrolase [Pyrinomonadaceae bacterium]|nr:hydrolase [Pyrinomonadaceae bacterium]
MLKHKNTLELSNAAFVIIDVQEAFRESIPNFEEITKNIVIFVEGSKLLNVPVIVTEQYPKGLKHTAREILDTLPQDAEVIEKTAFSSCGAQTFNEKLAQLNRTQIIVAGIEAHICVNQTVHDLLEDDFQVHLLSDCISSREKSNKKIAINKMQASGAIMTSVEMALFEMMRDAKHEQFKAIQKLIK